MKQSLTSTAPSGAKLPRSVPITLSAPPSAGRRPWASAIESSTAGSMRTEGGGAPPVAGRARGCAAAEAIVLAEEWTREREGERERARKMVPALEK